MSHMPPGWTYERLGSIASLNNSTLTDKISPDFEFRYLDLSGVKEGRISLPEDKLLFAQAPSRARRRPRRNDLIISTVRPNLKGFGIADFDTQDIVCSTGFALLTAPNETDAKFILHSLFSHDVERQIQGLVAGSNYPAISNSDVLNLSIPYPSEESERVQFVDLMNTWDEAIALQTRQLQQLQRRLTKLREDLLLAKRRLAGFSKPWQEVEIGTLLKEVKRRVVWNENEEYALISMRRRSGGAFLRERLFGHQILTKNLRTAHAGDFLISKRQIVHGASGLVPAELDSMKISDAYVALVARNPAAFDVNFFDCLSKMPWFYHLCYVCSHGIHIEKMMFDSADFLSRIIKVPDLDEQRAIAEVLNTAEAEIRLTERKLAALREQKRGLLQQLLTGEILLS